MLIFTRLSSVPFLFNASSSTAAGKAEKMFCFPSRVMRLAQTRSRNLPENIPPSGKIWQGPVFKALDKPKLAVKKDVRQV